MWARKRKWRKICKNKKVFACCLGQDFPPKNFSDSDERGLRLSFKEIYDFNWTSMEDEQSQMLAKKCKWRKLCNNKKVFLSHSAQDLLPTFFSDSNRRSLRLSFDEINEFSRTSTKDEKSQIAGLKCKCRRKFCENKKVFSRQSGQSLSPNIFSDTNGRGLRLAFMKLAIFLVTPMSWDGLMGRATALSCLNGALDNKFVRIQKFPNYMKTFFRFDEFSENSAEFLEFAELK